jgi:hypothetical protein
LSITALEHFANYDGHAMQYSLIAKSLMAVAIEYIEQKELRERLQRTESSSQLFGLVPRGNRDESDESMSLSDGARSMRRSVTREGIISKSLRREDSTRGPNGSFRNQLLPSNIGSPLIRGDLEATILGLAESQTQTPADLPFLNGGFENECDQNFGALNLFPLLETGGHIDLAHYL